MNLRLATLLVFVAVAVTLLYPLGSAAEPVAQPKIPHTLEGRDNCLACHGPGGLKPVPASHAGRNVSTCRGCHQVASASDAASSTETTASVSTPIPVQAPETQVNSNGLTPIPVNGTTPKPANATSAAAPVATAKPVVVSAQPTASATGQLPKSGDGDFIVVAGVAVLLIGLGIGIRRFSAAG